MDRSDKDIMKRVKRMLTFISILLVVGIATSLILVYEEFYPGSITPVEKEVEQTVEGPIELADNEIENGIHVSTGLIAKDGFELVAMNCGGCHSMKLVTQNRNTKDGWLETIRWMQETQKLWDLGDNENKIIEYLATNYGPVSSGRRKPLTDIEWYDLE